MTEDEHPNIIKVGASWGGGLYNLVFGDPLQLTRGQVFMNLLGLSEVGRYRDSWVEDHNDEPVIRFYTRMGGDNRIPYAQKIRALRDNEFYLSDADDEYDSTYASFYFKAPEQYRELLEEAKGPKVNMDQMWKDKIDQLHRQTQAASPEIKEKEEGT